MKARVGDPPGWCGPDDLRRRLPLQGGSLSSTCRMLQQHDGVHRPESSPLAMPARRRSAASRSLDVFALPSITAAADAVAGLVFGHEQVQLFRHLRLGLMLHIKHLGGWRARSRWPLLLAADATSGSSPSSRPAQVSISKPSAQLLRKAGGSRNWRVSTTVPRRGSNNSSAAPLPRS